MPDLELLMEMHNDECDVHSLIYIDPEVGKTRVAIS